MMPQQRPGDSVQNVETPWPLIQAIEIYLGERFEWDLAATVQNTKANRFISPQENSLEQDWKSIVGNGLCWLNPPFGKIAPWVYKCARNSHKVRSIVLLPASVGTNWFAEFVHNRANVTFIRPRLTFVGHVDPYPKDLMLCFYGIWEIGYRTWDWRTLMMK